MNYNLLSFMFSWIFPSKHDRRVFRYLCRNIEIGKKTRLIQNRYLKVLKKLKSKSKIKVLFLINEVSKWKTKSLYNEMQKSDFFEPVIALTIADIQCKLNKDEKKAIIDENLSFFIDKGFKTVCAYDAKEDKAICLKKFKPDIIFYQQPYDIPEIQDIFETSKYALSCYVPYYLPDYENFELDCGWDFHNDVFRFYVLNEDLKNAYKKYLKKEGRYCENIISAGHTMLDLYPEMKNAKNEDYVIYAPHWSIPHEKNKNNINISTFMETGVFILDYAKKHPEINWVFKPHPTLKTALKRIGEWSEEKINQYFEQWEKIALCCYDSNYLELFFKSKTIITDSGSFLLEYFLVGKPLIRLVSNKTENRIYKFLENIFNSFYNVSDVENLSDVLDKIIVKNTDEKLEERIKLLNSINLLKNNAAKNIVDDLCATIKGGQK